MGWDVHAEGDEGGSPREGCGAVLRGKMNAQKPKKFSVTHPPQGLGFARFMMVLGSFAPLFLLWAIRGNHLIPSIYFVPACLTLAVLPNLFLGWRWQTAKRHKELREISVGQAEDHRDHILVYLFSMLLPFYSESLDDLHSLAATLAALAFIIFLFWHLNLHYMNLLFAFLGYRVFTVYPPKDNNPLTGRLSFVLLTRREVLSPDDRLIAYRLSDTVYIESEEEP